MYRVTTLIGGPYVSGGGVNELYFLAAGGTEAQAATSVKAFMDGLKNIVLSGTTFEVLPVVEHVTDVTGLVHTAVAVTGATYTSANAGTIITPATQGLIQMRTGTYRDGREIRGRFFIPALGQGHATAGAP